MVTAKGTWETLADTARRGPDIWKIQLKSLDTREIKYIWEIQFGQFGYLGNTAQQGPGIWQIIAVDIIVENDAFRDISLFEKYSSNKPNMVIGYRFKFIRKYIQTNNIDQLKE